MLAYAVLNVVLILFLVFFIPENNALVMWIALMLMALLAAMYFYFFKSQRGKDVFNNFYGKANKAMLLKVKD